MRQDRFLYITLPHIVVYHFLKFKQSIYQIKYLSSYSPDKSVKERWTRWQWLCTGHTSGEHKKIIILVLILFYTAKVYDCACYFMLYYDCMNLQSFSKPELSLDLQMWPWPWAGSKSTWIQYIALLRKRSGQFWRNYFIVGTQ